MQIAFHLGAHCTDEGALLRVLLRNRARLLQQGIAVPEPGRYPALLQAAASLYAGRPAMPGVTETLLDALLPDAAEDGVHRIVLSFDAFLAFQRDAVTEAQLYPAAARRVEGLQRLFEGEEVSLLLALRNPATFLPALSARRQQKGLPALPADFDASALRWSELVGRLRAACPEARLTVWCDEDTPLIWHRVLRAAAGQPEALELEHALELATSLMEPAGARRMAAWFAETRPQTDAARQRGLAQFLERFAVHARLQMEFDMPGWSAETVARLTAAYEADCALIAGMERVEFLRP